MRIALKGLLGGLIEFKILGTLNAKQITYIGSVLYKFCLFSVHQKDLILYSRLILYL